MPNHNNIAEYIDNISLKKSFCMGFHPDEVYGVICDLTSMYNKVLAEAYEENEALKRKLEEKTNRPLNEKTTADTDNASSSNCYSQYTTSDEYANNIYNNYTQLFGDDLLSCAQLPCDNAKAEDVAEETEETDEAADKDLKRLKRNELLEIIVGYSKENEKLKETVSSLNTEKAELQKKLEDKSLKIRNAGSLAEASFLVNGVLESAQAAAQQYLDNLQELSKREEENCVKKEEAANEYAAKVIYEAQKERDSIHKNAIDKCSAMILIATERSEAIKKEADEYSASATEAVQARCRELEAESLKKCEEMEQEAIAKCKAMSLSAEAESEKVWASLTAKLEDFYKAHEGLRELLQAAGQFPNI